MELKIVKYSIDDLIVDYKGISDNLNEVCLGRKLKWEVSGICQRGDVVLLPLNQVDCSPYDYLFAPVNYDSVEGVEQEIRSHWQSETYLLGVIAMTAQEHLALYRRTVKKKD